MASGLVSVSALAPVSIMVSFWILVSGCTSPRIERTLGDMPMPGPEYQIQNIFAVDQLPTDLRRVAVLPVFAEKDYAVERDRFNELVQGQLRRAGRFEMIILDESELQNVVGHPRIPVSGQIPASLIKHLQARGVDGVFQLAINEYSPYRPFVLGVHARLFALREPLALWAVDELFRSSDREIIGPARRYALSNQDKRYPYSDSYAALRGPFLFSEYVVHTIVQTLPPASGP